MHRFRRRIFNTNTFIFGQRIDSRYRTNVGIVNLDSIERSFDVVQTTDDPNAPLNTSIVTVPPMSMVQIPLPSLEFQSAGSGKRRKRNPANLSGALPLGGTAPVQRVTKYSQAWLLHLIRAGKVKWLIPELPKTAIDSATDALDKAFLPDA